MWKPLWCVQTWWQSVKTRLYYHSANPIPESPAVLMSKSTTKHTKHTMRVGLNYTWNPHNLPHHKTNTIILQTQIYTHTNTTHIHTLADTTGSYLLLSRSIQINDIQVPTTIQLLGGWWQTTYWWWRDGPSLAPERDHDSSWAQFQCQIIQP